MSVTCGSEFPNILWLRVSKADYVSEWMYQHRSYFLFWTSNLGLRTINVLQRVPEFETWEQEEMSDFAKLSKNLSASQYQKQKAGLWNLRVAFKIESSTWPQQLAALRAQQFLLQMSHRITIVSSKISLFNIWGVWNAVLQSFMFSGQLASPQHRSVQHCCS